MEMDKLDVEIEGVEPPRLSICLVQVNDFDDWKIVGEDKDYSPTS
jgi:hypothetical protein